MSAIDSMLKAGLVFILVPLFLLSACDKNGSDYQRISGATMGTQYHISAKLPAVLKQSDIELAISTRLLEINQSMSTYIDDSEISQLNRLATHTWLTVSDDFLQVLAISQNVYEKSAGAFNPTIGPLVNLWGFGPHLSVENFQAQPNAELIAEKLQTMDFTALAKKGSKLKKLKKLHLDFSAVAKGYAVDEIAKLLQKAGVKNFMVEIGGEVKTIGVNAQNKPWRIGIEAPAQVRGKTFKALLLTTAAVATSGDYRNYLEIDGKRYSHIIDPATGYPVNHQLSSVTVISESVATADAWATAIMVLGQVKGFELAQQQNLAVYMIVREGDKTWVKYTDSMTAYLEY